MRALDIIQHKRDGKTLDDDEIRFFVDGLVHGRIPDYQVTAFLMAVFFASMTPAETGALTRAMIASGATLDLSGLRGPFVDKHSTGGVGDKVSLILAPLAAACGVQVPMMSGRALGHTGGTLDKLDSIPGFSTQPAPDRLREIIARSGFVMTGQSDAIVPADRILYALRDATGTVASVPLITSSILSKKFAEGADALVFDVKTGSGAFMKTPDQARELADSLVHTGERLGKRIVAVLTRMDAPLGAKVGNFLEVEEALALLCAPEALDRVPTDERSAELLEVTLRLTAWMLVIAGVVGDVDSGVARCREALETGAAWRAARANIELQGGDLAATLRMLGRFRAPEQAEIPARSDGYVAAIDAYAVGMGGVYLGVGRDTAESEVYPDVGFEVLKPVGSAVQRGEAVIRAWARDRDALDHACRVVAAGVRVAEAPPAPKESAIIEEIIGV